MNSEFDLWRLAAGLGLFLFGMHQLEQALTQLAGRSFKKFLRQYTAKPLRGVIAGAVSTAALQSSSVNDRFNAYFNQFREVVREFYEAFNGLKKLDVPSLRFEMLVEIKNKSETLYRRMRKRIYDEVSRGELSEVEISTLLNVNRELYASHHSLLSAVADALLDMESASDFESIPAMR